MAAVPHRWSLNSAVLIQRCLDLAIDKMSKANQRHLSVEWNISIPCTVLRQIIPHIDNIVAGRQFRCSAINRIFFKHKGIQKHLKQGLITKESRFTLKSRMKQRKIDFSAELPCQSLPIIQLGSENRVNFPRKAFVTFCCVIPTCKICLASIFKLI